MVWADFEHFVTAIDALAEPLQSFHAMTPGEGRGASRAGREGRSPMPPRQGLFHPPSTAPGLPGTFAFARSLSDRRVTNSSEPIADNAAGSDPMRRPITMSPSHRGLFLSILLGLVAFGA